jgi:eukaryotic-like serine/threonine-protein kinase
MIRISTSDTESELDRFVSAFEAAHARGAAGDLILFLPPRQHPRFLEILCEIVRIDLEFRWSDREPKSLADYRERFPELFADPKTLEAVCFEEYRLRRLAGEAVSAREYQRLFGVDTSFWDTGSSPAAATEHAPVPRELLRQMPRVGDNFLGFELTGELGRGAFATVFLARQAELAGRPVALKVSRERPGESQILARLQHTNIVPIYSTHEAGDLRVVCMPYFGPTTLADLLRAVRERGELPPSGASLVKTLRACRDLTNRENLSFLPAANLAESHSDLHTAAAPPAPATACLRAIAGLDYVEAVLWIASRLAEGLEHAHERGILHRDLKPANVLLADDGQPMLLDFNLSAPIRGEIGADRVGGTLPYMAPENLAALRDGVRGGDGRGDLYSLGVMLFELLTGRLPFPSRDGLQDETLEQMIRDRSGPPPSPRSLNRAVSPAVDAIVRKCLQPAPESRYDSAAALHDDLERQLRALPLRHVREPSRRERAAKWLRRHPRATSATSMAAVSAVLIGLMAAALLVRNNRLAGFEASAAFADFKNDFRAAQVAMLDGPTAARARLDKIETACRRALDRFRVLDDPAWMDHGPLPRLSPELRQEARADVGELLFLLAAVNRLRADGAPADEAHAAIGRARDLNRRAESAWPADQAPDALWQQRASFAADLGEGPEAVKSLARAHGPAPQSPRDACMAACLLVAQRRYRAALPLWQQATRLDPQNVWTWYGLGNCCQALGQLSQAKACYTACIALKPDHEGWYFSRGAVSLKQNEFPAAAADFDEVLRLHAGHAEAHLNRAIARIGLGQAQTAIDDLNAALALGGEQVRPHLLLARAWDQLGNAAKARSERSRGEVLLPGDEAAWVARAYARAALDPSAALHDVEQALRLNEYYLPAWESKVHLLAERLDRPDDAQAAIDRAITLYPEAAPLRAARGVLLARQAKSEAARRDAQAALQLDAAPAVQYQVACVHALLARENAAEAALALEFLTAALRGGYGGDLLRDDRDLAAVRSSPQYRQLLQAVDSLRLGAKQNQKPNPSAAAVVGDEPE